MIKFLKDYQTARPSGNHIKNYTEGQEVSLSPEVEKILIGKKVAKTVEEKDEKEKIPGLARMKLEELVEEAKKAGFDDDALKGMKREEIIDLLK